MSGSELGKLQEHAAVLHPDGKGLNRDVGGQRAWAARADLEFRAVSRADDDAALLVEIALGERAVVVGAAILDRAELALHVEDADGEIALAHDLHRPGRQLVGRADVDDRHVR